MKILMKSCFKDGKKREGKIKTFESTLRWQHGKVTLRDSIRMDSLKTMTIRVKTPRSDLNSLSLIVARDVGITPLNEAFNGSDYPSYVEYNYNNGQYGNPKVSFSSYPSSDGRALTGIKEKRCADKNL